MSPMSFSRELSLSLSDYNPIVEMHIIPYRQEKRFSSFRFVETFTPRLPHFPFVDPRAFVLQIVQRFPLRQRQPRFQPDLQQSEPG